MSDEPSLFPALQPVSVPDRFEGLGQDARRTLRQTDLIAEGFNPGSYERLHADAAKDRTGPGLRCRDCQHLYRAAAAKHSRRYVGIDLSEEYLELSLRTRLRQPGLDFEGASECL